MLSFSSHIYQHETAYLTYRSANKGPEKLLLGSGGQVSQVKTLEDQVTGFSHWLRVNKPLKYFPYLCVFNLSKEHEDWGHTWNQPLLAYIYINSVGLQAHGSSSICKNIVAWVGIWKPKTFKFFIIWYLISDSFDMTVSAKEQSMGHNPLHWHSANLLAFRYRNW